MPCPKRKSVFTVCTICDLQRTVWDVRVVLVRSVRFSLTQQRLVNSRINVYCHSPILVKWIVNIFRSPYHLLIPTEFVPTK